VLARGRRNLKGPGEKNEFSPLYYHQRILDPRGFFDSDTQSALNLNSKKITKKIVKNDFFKIFFIFYFEDSGKMSKQFKSDIHDSGVEWPEKFEFGIRFDIR
jgi:hypothetical protein